MPMRNDDAVFLSTTGAINTAARLALRSAVVETSCRRGEILGYRLRFVDKTGIRTTLSNTQLERMQA